MLISPESLVLSLHWLRLEACDCDCRQALHVGDDDRQLLVGISLFNIVSVFAKNVALACIVLCVVSMLSPVNEQLNIV